MEEKKSANVMPHSSFSHKNNGRLRILGETVIYTERSIYLMAQIIV